jgi:hypothetical protein
MVKGGNVQWMVGASRTVKTLGVAAWSDVQLIVDNANAAPTNSGGLRANLEATPLLSQGTNVC